MPLGVFAAHVVNRNSSAPRTIEATIAELTIIGRRTFGFVPAHRDRSGFDSATRRFCALRQVRRQALTVPLGVFAAHVRTIAELTIIRHRSNLLGPDHRCDRCRQALTVPLGVFAAHVVNRNSTGLRQVQTGFDSATRRFCGARCDRNPPRCDRCRQALTVPLGVFAAHVVNRNSTALRQALTGFDSATRRFCGARC